MPRAKSTAPTTAAKPAKSASAKPDKAPKADVTVGDGPHKQAIIRALERAKSTHALRDFFGVTSARMTPIYREGRVPSKLLAKLAAAAGMRPHDIDPEYYPNPKWSLPAHKFVAPGKAAAAADKP